MSHTVYLIDTYSLLFQVFHAIPPMTGPAGQPTNAVFGFSRDITALLRDRAPCRLICAMDSSGPNLRNDIYADYKANRTEMPEDLRPQIPMLKEVLAAFRLPVIELPGWEADDIIATLTRQAVERGEEVRIVTADKDARQLLGPQVQLLNLRKNTLMDEAGLLADWGVRPDQVIDFQSLVGDAVDNVPGVPLIGPKKAAQLLQQWGTLEEVLAHADEAPGAKLRQNLKDFAEQARISRQLVALNQHLTLDFDWEAPQETLDVDALCTLFRGLGFRRLIDDVEKLAGVEPSAQSAPSSPTAPATRKSAKSSKPAGRSLFGDTEDAESTGEELPPTVAQPTIERDWKIVADADSFASLLEELRVAPRIALDLETTGLDPLRSQIVGWAIAWKAGRAVYVPVQGPEGSQLLDPQTVVDGMRPILENPEVEWVNQNLKFDLILLRQVGIHPAKLGLDPMVGDYLLDAGARTHNLEVLMNKYLGVRGIPISDLIGSGKKQITLDQVPVEKVGEYATEDAEAAWRLVETIGDKLREQGLWELYWNVERPLIPVLADLEETGIRVDAEELQRQSESATAKLATLMTEIHDLAGHPFNIDSPLQLRKVLFEELGLPPKRKTKTGLSTDQEVLEELSAHHPLPAKIIEHRQLSKLKGTYLDALPLVINPSTGRIHASFNQVVAATGRLSSSDPNLQNIPIRTPEGRQVRKAFIPGEDGWKLVCADYSQIELRMLAHFSNDLALQDAFAQGIDIHAAVASDVYGVPLGEVTSDMRRVAKAVNFGVLYGQTSFGLAATLGISKDDAATFIEGYFEQYAGVTKFLEEVLDECAASGYARTILGRRRAIEGIRPASTRNRMRTMPERTAINTVIQGSAADLIKQAMIRVREQLRQQKHPARMLLQIHDELVFETPANEVASLVKLVQQEMKHAMEINVPLGVDVSVGDNWLDVEDFEE